MKVIVADGKILVHLDVYNDPFDRARKDILYSLHLFRWTKSVSAWVAKYDPAILLELIDTFGEEALHTDEATLPLFEKVKRAEKVRLKKREKFLQLKDQGTVDLEGYTFDEVPFGNHQRKALTALKDTNVAAIFFDCGLGKTYTSLMWLRWIKDNHRPDLKALVVSPLQTLYSAWAEDIDRFCPELTYMIGNSTVKVAREHLARGDFNICLLNFDKLRIMKDELVDAGFDAMIVDESFKIANARAKTTKAAMAVGKTAKYRAILSGLPAPNTELEYWAQMRFLSPRAFGSSFLSFRNKFFVPSGYGGFEWQLNPLLKDEFERRLKLYSIRAREEDYIDLPPQIDHRIKVILPPKAMQIYEDYWDLAWTELRVFQEDLDTGEVKVDQETWLSSNVLDKLLKVREICGGFLMKRERVWDDKKQRWGRNETIRSIHKAKVKAVEGLLEEIGPKPVLIWAQFHHEFQMLKEALPNAMIVNSSVPQKAKELAISTFKNTPEDQPAILLAHPKSIGHGLTFVNCCYTLWYSLGWSVDAFHQAKKRVHRIGQDKPVHYYYLEACSLGREPTLDSVIFERLQGKYQTQLELLNRLLELKHDTEA